jgi:glutamyl-Q tRNA(Asp) synthetase
MPPESAPVITRFAPSPSGLLHLGHAYAALFAWRAAEAAGGKCLLRIEDLDGDRCTAAFEAAILEDLAWLGLAWEAAPRRQSERMADYQRPLDRLWAEGLVYPCFCSRREIRKEIARSPRAPHGPDGPLYPGTCRELPPGEREARVAADEPFALRLDAAAAFRRTGPLTWHDEARGELAADPGALGDAVLARKELGTGYHLAVVLDDADQGVTLVTRGEDLLPSTHIHRLLQALLDLPVPRWHHHRLLTEESGERLAKRNDALSIRALRQAGKSPGEVRALAGFPD